MVQELPNYTDFDTLLQAFKVHAARFKANTLLHYQLPNSLELKELTYGQIDKISTLLANTWRPTVPAETQCIALMSEDPAQAVLAFFAVLKLGLIYFPLSIHNTERANVHLLKETNTTYMIASETYRKNAMGCAAALRDMNFDVKIWEEFDIDQLIATTEASVSTPTDENTSQQSEGSKIADPNAIVTWLHSSGTTAALPKLIPYNTRSYLFALLEIVLKPAQEMCPDLAMDSSDVILVTEKLFHAPAILMLIMSVLTGASILLLNNEKPMPPDILAAADICGATVLQSPPIFLEKLAEYLEHHVSDDRHAETLQRFKFSLIGGSPLRTAVGDYLHLKGLNVQNAYGMTETGYLSLSNISKDNKRWNSIEPSNALLRYVTFEPYEKDLYQLIIHSTYPAFRGAGNRPNGDLATRDLFVKDSTRPGNWTFVGRTDDILLMSIGEKLNPVPMEEEVCNEDIVRSCIIVGEDRPWTSALVELIMDKALQCSPVEMTSKVYEAVNRANKHAPSHGLVTVPDMVYILPLNKQLPTTPKGSVIRPKALEIFNLQLDEMYDTYHQKVIGDISVGNGFKGAKKE